MTTDEHERDSPHVLARVRVTSDGDLPEERISLITAKIAQSPCVLKAYWHYL